MSTGDIPDIRRHIQPATTQSVGSQQADVSSGFAQALREARQTGAAPSTNAPDATANQVIADQAAGTNETLSEAAGETVPGRIEVTRYHPYAQTPLRSLPESEPRLTQTPSPESGPTPTIPIVKTGLRQPREWHQPETQVFLRFAKHLASEDRGAGGGASGRGVPELFLPPDRDIGENWFRERGYDMERLDGLADVFFFNVAAVVGIAGADGVCLPEHFMADPKYLTLTGGSRFFDAGGADAFFAGMRAFLSPPRVAARTVDMAVCLARFPETGGALPVRRRAYAGAVLRLVGHVYNRAFALSRDPLYSRPLLRHANVFIRRWMSDFSRSGPDPAKDGIGGLYDSLRSWANAWRVSYHPPSGHDAGMDAATDSPSLDSLKPAIDNIV